MPFATIFDLRIYLIGLTKRLLYYANKKKGGKENITSVINLINIAKILKTLENG